MQRSRAELIGIYLNDHLAGATVGTGLAHRVARSHDEVADQATLQRLAGEINADRRALLEIMALLGVPVRHYKTGAAWLGERVGRLKPNGHLRTRSPLSSLEELELLRLGVQGKAAGWRTLRELAARDARLSAAWLDELLARARAQADQLEDLRVRAAARPHRGHRRAGSGRSGSGRDYLTPGSWSLGRNSTEFTYRGDGHRARASRPRSDTWAVRAWWAASGKLSTGTQERAGSTQPR